MGCTMKWLKRIVGVLCAVIFVYFGVLAFQLWQWDQKNTENPVPLRETGNELNPRSGDLLFLLVGLDHTGDNEPTRTDTILLVRVNAEEKAITMLSIPRDSRVPVDGEYDKINHAHAYGGIEETLQTVRDFLHLDIDYYMEVDYETVKGAVDAIGGVEYTVPEGVEINLDGVQIHPGKQRFDGVKALTFLRNRATYAEGDLGRVHAQQEFLQAVLRDSMSWKNFFRFPFLLQAISANAHTNIGIFGNLGLGFDVVTGGAKHIEVHTVPGEGDYIDGISYYVPWEEETRALAAELFSPWVISE